MCIYKDIAIFRQPEQSELCRLPCIKMRAHERVQKMETPPANPGHPQNRACSIRCCYILRGPLVVYRGALGPESRM